VYAELASRAVLDQAPVHLLKIGRALPMVVTALAFTCALEPRGRRRFSPGRSGAGVGTC